MLLKCTRKPLSPELSDQLVAEVFQKILSVNPLKVILFGSAAEKKLTDQSDLDFLVVCSNAEQMKTAQKKLKPKYPLCALAVDLVWVTLSDFETKKNMGGVCMVAHQEGRYLL